MKLKEKKSKNWIPPKIEHNKLTQWNWMVGHPKNLRLGKYVDIGAFCYINARFGVEIGDYTQFGSHCSIYSHNTINNTEGKVVIGEHCRIGSHSLILPGVVLKPHTFIKAGSIVYQIDGVVYAKTPTLYSFTEEIE